ncbi:hypothetical protein [Nocardioides lacusdianchii]|uniref:hypothetical protein n=1 Tax=Nocardioides lacusdianchii TaxID=2783664 RepID=UPI001CCCC6B2|nr:hypothetical protein [Nocardioides lacusdianchii]
MANYTRRTVVRGAAWTVPVIAVAAPIPAFATSLSCRPFAECKKPGASQDNTKTYVINSNCGTLDNNIASVTVDGKDTTFLSAGRYETVQFKDSGNYRDVVITFTDGTIEEYKKVPFPPCAK